MFIFCTRRGKINYSVTSSEAKGHVVGLGLLSVGGFRAPVTCALIGWRMAVPRGRSSVILKNKQAVRK